MSTSKIPPVNKSKIISVTDNNIEDFDEEEDYDDMMNEIYMEEKRMEYVDTTLLLLQKSLLDYVDRKSLTICEYLSVDKIKKYLRQG